MIEIANYNEPKYDTDQVNYGFLRKILNSTKEETDKEIIQCAKNFSSPPNPPYYEGWTYTQNNKIYRCIKDRFIGSFSIADWVLIYDYNRQNAMLKSFLLLSELELSEQSDGEIETFYQDNNPSLEWDTTIIKSKHEGDYWRVNENGIYRNYQYVKHTDNPVSYIWEQVDVPITIFNTTNGKKKIYTRKPTSYKKSDFWKIKAEDLNLFPNLDLKAGDYVESTCDSLTFDHNHWYKKEDELSLKPLDTYYYTTTEINKIIEIINKNIQTEIVKGDDFVKAFVKEGYTTQETTNNISKKVDSNGKVIEQILGESIAETPTLNLAELSLLSKEIKMELIKKVNDIDITGARIMLEINNDVSEAKINADKIALNANDILNIIAGNEINLGTKNLSIAAENFSLSKEGYVIIKQGKIANFEIINNNLSTSITLNYDYNQNDLEKVRKYIIGTTTLSDKEFLKYDLNHDGKVDALDFVRIFNIIEAGISKSSPGKFEINASPDDLNIFNFYDGEGNLKYYIGYWINKLKYLETETLKTNNISAGNIDSGKCVLTASGERTINFNKKFTSEPNVVLTPITIANGVIAAKITGISTTYFKATIGGTDFGDTDFFWIAISN